MSLRAGAARCFDGRVSHLGVSRRERAGAGDDALLLASPSEVLVATSAELPAQLERIPARTRVEDWVWTREFAVPLVERQLNVRSLEGFGLSGHEAGGDCGGRGAALRAHDAEE